MNQFCENLRKIRIEKGMSQEEFASLLGTTKQVISRYENNQRSPKVSIVAEYAEKLGVSVGFLTGDMSGSLSAISSSLGPDARKLRGIEQALSHAASNPEIDELVGIYLNLNDLGQKALMGTARGLAANPDMKKDGASNGATA